MARPGAVLEYDENRYFIPSGNTFSIDAGAFIERVSTPYRVAVSGMMSLICDDGFKTDKTLLLPVFVAAGVMGATAITTNNIGEDGYMDLDDLADMAAAGWNFLAHQKDHDTVAGVTDEAWLKDQIVGSRKVIEGWGYEVDAFVAPFNASTELSRKWVMEGYRAGFSHTPGGGMDGINIPPLNQYRLARVPIDGTDSSDVTEYEGYIDDAKARGGWVVFYIHESTEDYAAVIADLLEYAATEGVEVLTPSAALDRIGNTWQTGELDSGRGACASSDGDLRVRNLYTSGELRVQYGTYPWNEDYCTIVYAAGNMVLSALNATEYIHIGTAAGISPSTNYDKVCGDRTHYWKCTSTKEIDRCVNYSPYALSDKVMATGLTISGSAATATKDIAVGAGSKVMAISIRNTTEIVGPATYDVAYTAGVVQGIATAVSVADENVTVVMFDENAASAISAAANVRLTFTANGGTGTFDSGTFYCALWYQKFTTE